jgi:hypothetical protein
MQGSPPILDQGIAQRMKLGNACAAYALFAVTTSLIIGGLLILFGWVLDKTIIIGPCAAIGGPLLMVPMGCSGIAIIWKLSLGAEYSAKLRKGDFRFAGIVTPLFVWGVAAIGEYLIHLPEGHQFVEAMILPLVIAGMTTYFALRDRRRKPLM